MKNKNNVVLEIRGLKKYFTNNGYVNKAVDDVSFNLHEGEIVGLIGESGSGKTTVGRSLLRLYDDFNGFVALNKQVISGKKLSKNQKKFLRRNIQMIFQDPHAALNGQKNIYSTLREPLIVNGIIHEQMKDIFKDWELVKKTFHYTFQYRAKKIKLDNLKAINDLAVHFFPDWKDKLSNYEYDANLNYEDNFNAFYNYLEEKQNMESQIVNNMYSNTEKLISYYYAKQNQLRANDLELDEQELIQAKDEREKTKALLKTSLNAYEANLKLINLKNELKTFKHEWKNRVQANRNTFSNYIKEFKMDKKIDFYNRIQAFDLNFYAYSLKKGLLNKFLYQYTKNISRNLGALDYQQAQNLMLKLKKSAFDFYNQKIEKLTYSKDIKKVITNLLNTEFNFKLDKYTHLNATELEHKNKVLSDYQSQINHLETIIKNETQPAKTQSDLALAQEKYNQAQAKSQEELAKFIEKEIDQIYQLHVDISENEKQYQSLRAMQSETDALFKVNSDKFFATLKADYEKLLKEQKQLTKKSPEWVQINKKVNELKKLIAIYHSKIKNKLNTLQSFKIEVKYLQKDINAIYLLLGLNNDKALKQNSLINKVKTLISKLTKKDLTKSVADLTREDIALSKTIPVLGNVQMLWNRLLASWKVRNLLIKMTIYKSLEDVGLLKQFAYRYPHEFSGGQRQRIVIARALITQPKVIVADEPIASLDISIQAQVVNLLKDLCEKKNIGMIFIAHDLSMIEYIADRVQIMHLGKIVESGETNVVYNKPLHPYTINLFKAIPKISNANEKFENINFELDYLKDQQFPKVPKLYKVEDDHFIYGTKDQVTNWVKPFNLNDFVLATEDEK
ncbi:ATP-binding cassette domain-containing protein [Mycoplasmopsis gallinarum]|uniref:ATP-binding cassette domain-containing protein n=1 Tax=Mycoplasmopsis gallinarum TaxID=29557 RepID=UPI0004814748|nr:ATP-binding cassette domain-containing protein [Mycoplasmopsis gallinarum]